jgi:hypothetical protein
MLTNKNFEKRINIALGVKQIYQDNNNLKNKNHLVYTIFNSKPIKVELFDNPDTAKKPKFGWKSISITPKEENKFTERDGMFSFYSQSLVDKQDALNNLRLKNNKIFSTYETEKKSEDLRKNYTHNDFMKMFDIEDIKRKYKESNEKFKNSNPKKNLCTKFLKNKIKSKVVTRAVAEPLPDITNIDSIKYNTMISTYREDRDRDRESKRKTYNDEATTKRLSKTISPIHTGRRATFFNNTNSDRFNLNNFTTSYRRDTVREQRTRFGSIIILPKTYRADSPRSRTQYGNMLQVDQSATPAMSFKLQSMIEKDLTDSPIKSVKSNFTLNTLKNFQIEIPKKYKTDKFKKKLPTIQNDDEEDEVVKKDPIDRYLTQVSFFQTNMYKDYRVNCKNEYERLLKALNRIEHSKFFVILDYAKSKTLKVDEINEYLKLKKLLDIEKYNRKFEPRYYDN